MSDDQNIPFPDKSGSSGSQELENTGVEAQIDKPLDGLHLSRTIEGLASSHSRSMGGEVTSALIAGVTTQVAIDYQELKVKHDQLTSKFEIQRNELEACRIEKAVYSERIQSDTRNKHLRNLSITIGTTLFGVGIYLSRTSLDKYAFGAYGLGLLLLLFGWLSGPKGVQE